MEKISSLPYEMRQYIFDLYISLLRTRLGMVKVEWLFGRPCYTIRIDDDRSRRKLEWLHGRPYYNTIRIDDDRSMAGIEWCTPGPFEPK